MNKRSYTTSILFLIASFAMLFGQSLDESFYATPEDLYLPDTTDVLNEEEPSATIADTIIVSDTTIAPIEQAVADTIDTDAKEAFRPDPDKVLWLGAIIPGYGQILNKKYWKLPIVYGGFMGCAYAVSYYSRNYQIYKIAYRDIVDQYSGGTSYMDLLPAGTEITDYFNNKNEYADYIQRYRDNYLRYRDLSIVITVVYYALTILEAYVDAQLFDYDISPDLSMRVRPAVINNDVTYATPVATPDNMFGRSNAFGVQWSIQLK